MEATGPMKYFYDIYYLATTFDFEGGNFKNQYIKHYLIEAHHMKRTLLL